MSKCVRCGAEFGADDYELCDDCEAIDCLQDLADELVETIAADPEVKEIPVNAYIRDEVVDENVTSENLSEMVYALPVEVRGLRRTSECCYIASEDVIEGLKSWHYGYFSHMAPKELARKDYYGVPVMMINEKYRLCHTPSKCMSTTMRVWSNNAREASIPVMIFGNLEKYQDGDKQAVVKLVFPKRAAVTIELRKRKKFLGIF